MFSGLESSRGSSFGKDDIVGRREAEFPVSSITENVLRLRAGCAVLGSRVMVVHSI